MKIHPLNIILFGLYIVSLGFNVLMYTENKRLIEEIKQKPKVIIIPFIQEKPKNFTSGGVKVSTTISDL